MRAFRSRPSQRKQLHTSPENKRFHRISPDNSSVANLSPLKRILKLNQNRRNSQPLCYIIGGFKVIELEIEAGFLSILGPQIKKIYIAKQDPGKAN